MTTARISVGDHSIDIVVEGVSDRATTGPDADDPGRSESRLVLPVGVLAIAQRHISSDPPLPEQLTNAIGEVLDHIEDAKRELPLLIDTAEVVVSGAIPRAIAAVEVGAAIESAEFILSRDAAEDVFRTMATETHSERRHNPGLPSDLVSVIVGGCCVIVGVIRGLQLDGVTVSMDPADHG